VPRLYKKCRPGGRYERVMNIFTVAKQIAPHIPTKTGIILGMGETIEEVELVMADLRKVDVDILTLGQYLRPSEGHVKLDRYVTPDEFRHLYDVGMSLGFRHVESGPLELPRVGASASGRRVTRTESNCKRIQHRDHRDHSEPRSDVVLLVLGPRSLIPVSR
jgi:lipoate synthase